MMNAVEFNKAVSKHCKDMSGDCCKCDLRLYCYLSPSERCDELVSLVIDFCITARKTKLRIPITVRLLILVFMIWT